MSISTIDKPQDRKSKIAALRDFHQATLDSIGASDGIFIPKMAYKANGNDVISFFLSEINKGGDIFTEFTNRDLESEDPTRTLYKWKFNPFFEDF